MLTRIFHDWEHRLASVAKDRVVRPFNWGLEWTERWPSTARLPRNGHAPQEYLRELNRVRTARALASPLTEMLSIFLLCALVLGAGWFMMRRPDLSPTDFILAIVSLAVAGASLKPLTGLINDIQSASPAAQRLLELMRAKPEPGHGLNLARLPRHAESIEIRGASLTYPGAPYDFADTPWQIRRRAPLLGEHNEEIYLSELGLSRRELSDYRERGVI